MHKLILAIASATALVASPASATHAATPLSIATPSTRTATPMAKRSRLNDQSSVPVWVLAVMGAAAAVIAIIVVVDPSFGDDTPDSN